MPHIADTTTALRTTARKHNSSQYI